MCVCERVRLLNKRVNKMMKDTETDFVIERVSAFLVKFNSPHLSKSDFLKDKVLSCLDNPHIITMEVLTMFTFS